MCFCFCKLIFLQGQTGIKKSLFQLIQTVRIIRCPFLRLCQATATIQIAAVLLILLPPLRRFRKLPVNAQPFPVCFQPALQRRPFPDQRFMRHFRPFIPCCHQSCIRQRLDYRYHFLRRLVLRDQLIQPGAAPAMKPATP